MKISSHFLKEYVGTTVIAMGLIMGWQSTANAVDASDFSMDTGLRWEDNLSLSPKSADKVSDLIAHISFAGNFGLVDTETNQFSIGVNAHYDYVTDTSDLSNYGALISLNYRRNFGADFNAPWIALDADGQILRFNDSDIRDGYIINTTATVGRQLNPKVGISGGYRYFIRRSNMDNSTQQEINWQSDKVFDLDRHNIFARFDFTVSVKTSLYVDINYFDGDVAASGRSFNDGMAFPRAHDPAFGDGYLAWRIDANGFEGKFGVVQQFSNNLSLNAFAAYLSANGDSNNDYDNTIIQAFLTYQF